jgi:hypothetical protein
MNERIRELARRSGALPTQDCGVPQWYIDEDEFEKFAELIVRECIEIANSKAEGIDLARELYLYTTDIEYAIKEHFGVEE